MARSSDGGGDVVRESLEALTRDLRRWRPAKVRVIVGGEPREVAVPGSKRHRWESVAKLVLSLEWTRVELLDAKGALLHFVDAEVVAADDDDGDVLGLDVNALLGKPGQGLDREHGLIALVLKAQQVALSHQAVTLSTVTDGYRTLTETVFRRLEHMEATFGRTLQMAHDAAQRVAQVETAGDPNDAAILALIEKTGVLGGGGDAKRLGRLLDRAEKVFGVESKVTQQAAPTNGAAKVGG